METKNQGIWPEIYSSRQSKTILRWPASTIEEYNVNNKKTLCLTVLKNHIKGIIPDQESGFKLDGDLRQTRTTLSKLLGQEISFIVLDIDEKNEIFSASRKQALDRLSMQGWSLFQEGQTHEAVISRIVRNGAYVEINGVESFLPIQEMKHGWVNEIVDIFVPGDKVKVKIKNMDKEKERITVSVKDTIPNPWPDAARRYTASNFNLYTGTVTGVIRSGVFVEFEPGVNALCHHYRKDPYAINRGDTVAIEIYRIIPEKERISGKIRRIIKKAS